MGENTAPALSLGEIARLTGCELRGDRQRTVSRVQTLDQAGADAISFRSNARYKHLLKDSRAGAVILSADDADACSVDCLISDNPYLAHAVVIKALYPAPDAAAGIHPSATVAAGAQIDKSAEIGPGTFIGAGAVIGGDGFGLANDDGTWVKVPQIGGTVLGDDVEVGSCSSVDRGATRDTVIAEGVKLDSQVHVAHSVRIGKHTAIAGCVGIAGSSQIGTYCTIAGAAGITGHIELGDHVHISGATSVTR